MNSNLLTNTLLVIIAVLLLVQVIQNGVNQPGYSNRPQIISQNPHSEGSMDSPRGVQPPQMMQTNMIFQALKAFPKGCEGKQILAECSSPEAEAVKAQIEQFEGSGKGIRQTFDYIVSTWGEKALTEQALQIRKMRKPAR